MDEWDIEGGSHDFCQFWGTILTSIANDAQGACTPTAPTPQPVSQEMGGTAGFANSGEHVFPNIVEVLWQHRVLCSAYVFFPLHLSRERRDDTFYTAYIMIVSG
jgi:hypothetical protein